MRDFHLEFSPFSFVALHEGTVHKQVNEHSTAYVKGIIHESDVKAYSDLIVKNEHIPFSITAVSDDGQKIVIFQGVTYCPKIKCVGKVATLTIEAKSGSYLLDINEHFRTFQDPAVTHSEVLDLLGQPYTDYNYILKTTLAQAEAASVFSKASLMNKMASLPGISATMLDKAYPASDLPSREQRPSDTALTSKLDSFPGVSTLVMDKASRIPDFLPTGHMSSALPGAFAAEARTDRRAFDVPTEGSGSDSRPVGRSAASENPSGDQGPLSGLFASHDISAMASMAAQNLRENKAEAEAEVPEDTPLALEQIHDMSLGQFTVQYWETDWAFAKRLASRLNTFLVPADTMEGTRFYFGTPCLNGYLLDDSVDYEIIKDYKICDEKKRLGLNAINEADALYYVVELRDIFAVGDMVQLQGMELHVARIVTCLVGQEFVHTYYLQRKQGLRTPRYCNKELIGASLDGQVLAVWQDQVQVWITSDENVEQKVVQWFPFATAYSSPDGTGWYAMPEPGDQIRLYMPDEEEARAVAFNALHVASKARSNPDIKSMRNKFGKEIRFTPNTLVMTNNTGMEISIIDGEGIRIDSNKNIFIKADGNIDISCAAGLSMLAGDSVVVQQGGTSFVVDDEISFIGGQLNMQ